MADPRAMLQSIISLTSASLGHLAAKVCGDATFEREAKSQQCGAAVMLKLLDLAGELG